MSHYGLTVDMLKVICEKKNQLSLTGPRRDHEVKIKHFILKVSPPFYVPTCGHCFKLASEPELRLVDNLEMFLAIFSDFFNSFSNN